ncbi:MAG: hypothetical protein WA996_24990 [Candidatus Promineifilaceae bacterium]
MPDPTDPTREYALAFEDRPQVSEDYFWPISSTQNVIILYNIPLMGFARYRGTDAGHRNAWQAMPDIAMTGVFFLIRATLVKFDPPA